MDQRGCDRRRRASRGFARHPYGAARRRRWDRHVTRLPTVTPSAFRRLAVVATALLAIIVVSGAAVRLTSSGLGFPTWPRCTDTSLVAPPSYHALVEFINRVVSTAVGLVVAAPPRGAPLDPPA